VASVSENLLLHRRPAPHQRAVRNSAARLQQRAVPSPVTPPHPLTPAEIAFAPRNSPTDLVFRALWQLVGVYVYLVLLVKDRRLPR
jgi:hypothetical protein